MQSTNNNIKTCDGIYLPTNTPVTMELNMIDNFQCTVSLITIKSNQIIFYELITSNKTPIFENYKFSLRGREIFVAEKESYARYNDLKKFFESKFNIITTRLMYNGDNYNGDVKNDIPHGNGMLYYGDTKKPMCSSTFENGMYAGHTIFYSYDGNIVVDCDDICNNKAVQYGTIYYKNNNISKTISFDDFNELYPDYLSQIDMDVERFINKVSTFALNQDPDIKNTDNFIFSNKNKTEQMTSIYSSINALTTIQNKQLHQINHIKNYFMFLICYSVSYHILSIVS